MPRSESQEKQGHRPYDGPATLVRDIIRLVHFGHDYFLCASVGAGVD
ncbi:hypothetical protein AH4AK4_3695 [Aeromonas hydrophila 4AK4]|nr:hypothetical protein AH4AK4_3695 [Aeromonas hydrophila 4AK4]